MDIKGQAAIVTGGGSGLGEGTARALAASGAKVAVLDINHEAAARVAGEIGGLAIACDVASAASAEAAIATARSAHGVARLLVNCAGIAPAARIVGKDGPMALDAFRRTIEINLIGTFNMMRLAASDMQTLAPNADGERGLIVMTASVAAFDGQIGQAGYAASKGGVAALTLPAAREFAKTGIRVMSIAPGLFGTPMLLGMPQALQDSLASQVPFPTRFGRPDEYAALVLHMLANPMLNGETIRLDGAIRMGPK
jgi:NAD(P)-dependent dehydrogenase (short-subunit alcohol dehydrogenase family)